MSAGAATPEELETLFEDAFVMRDVTALCALFDGGGVLVRGEAPPACGGEQIAQAAGELWRAGRTYVGGSGRVLQSRGAALVVGGAGLHVASRAPDGTWRIAIALLETSLRPAQEDT